MGKKLIIAGEIIGTILLVAGKGRKIYRLVLDVKGEKQI